MGWVFLSMRGGWTGFTQLKLIVAANIKPAEAQ
jgi:hypothetical protein